MTDIENIVRSTTILTFNLMVKKFGLTPDLLEKRISKNKASKLWGRRRIERLMNEGRIKAVKGDKRNSRYELSINEIEKAINK